MNDIFSFAYEAVTAPPTVLTLLLAFAAIALAAFAIHVVHTTVNRRDR